jgi:hypothetical protein
LLPQRCSIKESDHHCVNPPDFIISVVAGNGEYMIGVICENHKKIISGKLEPLQKEGKLPQGKIKFEKLKVVGTNCIKASPDDLIQL